MILLDVFYTAVATIVVIALLQLITFAVVRIMYPPEPKVIYRDVPVHAAPAAPQMAPINLPMSVPVSPPVSVPLSASLPPVLTQQTQEVQLPEYEPRSTPSSTSLRLDSGFPDGLQETRPPGV